MSKFLKLEWNPAVSLKSCQGNEVYAGLFTTNGVNRTIVGDGYLASVIVVDPNEANKSAVIYLALNATQYLYPTLVNAVTLWIVKILPLYSYEMVVLIEGRL